MSRGQGGFAVLIILWMLALLALIADRMIVVGQAETRIAYNLRTEAAAEAAADGGVFEAIYRLMQTKPGAWKADGRRHFLSIGGQTVNIRLEDEAAKINLNSASFPMLQALLQQLGQPLEAAQSLAQAIIDWRSTTLPMPRVTQIAAEYRAAGLPRGPAQASFVTIAELGGVIGMTPALVAQIAPHVTVTDAGGKNPGRLDPVVAAVLKSLPAAPPAKQTGTSTPARTLTIRSWVGTGGVSFERDAIVKIGGPAGYRILAWAADGNE